MAVAPGGMSDQCYGEAVERFQGHWFDSGGRGVDQMSRWLPKQRKEPGKWRSARLRAACPRERCPLWLHLPREGPHQTAGGDIPPYSATPFSLSISHTRSGLIGISTCVTPRCASASTTAFAIAGGAPTVADSPTPFAPSG